MSSESSKDLRSHLRSFVRGENPEEAFRKIADDLGALIYHSALRQSGDVTIAEEATQKVFLLIAKQAGKLARHPEILAWVHRTTRNKVLEMLRADARRKKREMLAMEYQNDGEEVSSRLLEELDESLDRLSGAGREVILLKFFEGETYPAIASRTGRSESAEKMRVKRALEKMAGWLGKKGVALSVAGLTTVLSTEMAKAAPVGLALVSTGSEASAVGATTAGSGKLAAGVALLLAAGLALPISAKWREVRELESRAAELTQGGVISPSLRGEGNQRQRSAKTVLRDLEREIEEVESVEVIAERLIKNSFYGEILETRKLERQLELLTLEELRQVGLIVFSPRNRKAIDSAKMIAKAMRDHLSAPDAIMMISAVGAHPYGASGIFNDWCDEVGLEEPGRWLRGMNGDPRIQGKGLWSDAGGDLREKYLERLVKEDPDAAVAQLSGAHIPRIVAISEGLASEPRPVGAKKLGGSDHLFMVGSRDDQFPT